MVNYSLSDLLSTFKASNDSSNQRLLLWRKLMIDAITPNEIIPATTLVNQISLLYEINIIN